MSGDNFQSILNLLSESHIIKYIVTIRVLKGSRAVSDPGKN